MREAHDELREAIPGVRLILAAMGPKMCALAGAALRRRLLQLDDRRLRRRRARARSSEGAAEAGRETPRVYGYVRTAVGADAETRLAKEEGFYRDLHDGYRNHFERLGEPPGTVGVAAERPGRRRRRARRLRGARHVVVRGLASARLEAMDRVADAPPPAEPTESTGSAAGSPALNGEPEPEERR